MATVKMKLVYQCKNSQEMEYKTVTELEKAILADPNNVKFENIIRVIKPTVIDE